MLQMLTSTSPSLPGTPSQCAPDYVLHPLSIYRMARKTIPEKHAPEKIPSPATSITSPAASTSANLEEILSHGSQPETYIPPPNGVQAPAMQSVVPMDDLQMLLPSDLTSFWQPADTVASGAYSYGVPQWMAEFGPNEPMFNFWPQNR